MSDPVQRLGESGRGAYVRHLGALPAEDTRLRFGTALSPDAVAAYVAGIDFDRDAVFGAHDDTLELIGAAHVGMSSEIAELGVSVLPGHRGRGVGTALVARATEHARNRSVPRLFMHCLAENAPMMRIARRAGMEIVVDSGDADAHVALAPASAASIAGEYVSERVALYDYALKAQIAAWRGINAALAGAGKGPA